MNFFFWLLVAIALIVVWFCLSFAFRGIGGIGLRLWNDAKREISDEESEKNERE